MRLKNTVACLLAGYMVLGQLGPAQADDLATVKARNGTSPTTTLDGEPMPDARLWIELGKHFQGIWNRSQSPIAKQVAETPVDYLSIKDYRCKWGRPAFAMVDKIYLCPANIVWYSEIGTYSIVTLFAQLRWNQGADFSQYAGDHLFMYAVPRWRNEVVAGVQTSMYPNSWMLLFCFRSGISAKDCSPRSHGKSFDVWWTALYSEPEHKENSHVVRFWDISRQQFWLIIHFLLAHEAGHILLGHPSATSQVDIDQELAADRFAVRFLTAVNNDPLDTLFTLQVLRFASSVVQRSGKSSVQERLSALSVQMRKEIVELVNDDSFWVQVSTSFGAEMATALRLSLRSGEGVPSLPWERAR